MSNAKKLRKLSESRVKIQTKLSDKGMEILDCIDTVSAEHREDKLKTLFAQRKLIADKLKEVEKDIANLPVDEEEGEFGEGSSMQPAIDVHEFDVSAEELAKMLDGNQYGSEITKEQQLIADDNGLVVMFGYGDDTIEFSGAISGGYYGAYEGRGFYIDKFAKSGVPHNDCDEDCPYFEKIQEGLKETGTKIKLLWSKEDDKTGKIASWIIKTEIKHHQFRIWEGKDLYCVGIVFSVDDLEGISEEDFTGIILQDGLKMTGEITDLKIKNADLRNDVSVVNRIAQERGQEIISLKEKVKNQSSSSLKADNFELKKEVLEWKTKYEVLIRKVLTS